jgi:hypothetical protein
MKYEKTSDSNFLSKWRFQIQMAHFFDWATPSGGGKAVERWKSVQDANGIKAVEDHLRFRARGAWHRAGNNFYLNNADDVLALRLQFDHTIRFIREASAFPRPQW